MTEFQKPNIDLTLDRIHRLATYLPSYTRPTCHITGTNGKGSVTALLSSIFLASFPPLSIGRFNSPHLVSVYDSILINNEPVTHDDYSTARAEVQNADRDHCVCASSFELLVMTALRIFECKQLDVVVIEVGMGGRLDATNIIPDDAVLISALTAVDLDHQYFLGDTVEEIAREKAGIARRGKPFVVGRQKYPTVLSAVEEVLHRLEEGSDPNLPISISAQTLIELGGDELRPAESLFSPSNLETVFSRSVRLSLDDDTKIIAKLPLYGDHQLDNLGTAISILSTLLKHPSCLRMLPHDIHTRITSETVSRGISSTKWPGRLSFHTITLPKMFPNDTEHIEQERCSLVVLADGAHNPASSETLRRFIDQVLGHCGNGSQPVSLTFVLALSYSPPKTPLQTLSPLLLPPFPLGKVKIAIALVEFTPPEGMPWVRPVPPSDVQQAITQLVPDVEVRVPNHGNGSEGQVLRALRWAAEMQEVVSDEQGLVVIAGSLYLVADFYRLLQSLGQS